VHLTSFYTPFSDEIGEFSQDRECIGTKWELSGSAITMLNQECIQVISRLSDLGEVCEYLIDHMSILQKMAVSTTLPINQGIHSQVTVVQNLVGTLAVGDCHYDTGRLFIRGL